MMLRLALPRRDRLGGGGRHQRHAAGGQGRRAAGGDKRAFQEAAPFGVEIVEQLLAVELEVGAIAIIACTHWRSSLGWIHNTSIPTARGPDVLLMHAAPVPISIPRHERNRGSTSTELALSCSRLQQSGAGRAGILCTFGGITSGRRKRASRLGARAAARRPWKTSA
jgi:hypothetical protein